MFSTPLVLNIHFLEFYPIQIRKKVRTTPVMAIFNASILKSLPSTEGLGRVLPVTVVGVYSFMLLIWAFLVCDPYLQHFPQIYTKT